MSLNSKTIRKAQAVVFPGNGGYFHLDLVSDAAVPVGPFATKKAATESARVTIGTDRWLNDAEQAERRRAEEVNAMLRAC